MKRYFRVSFLFFFFAIVPIACTSSSTSFSVENGVCYRIKTNSTAGCQTNESKVQASDKNCGLPEE